jgi:hypothetical protein
MARQRTIVLLVCSYCEKEFNLDACQYRTRLRQMERNRGDSLLPPVLFCSKSCGGHSNPLLKKGQPLKHGDDWEKILHNLGLGMYRGVSSLLAYGYDDSIYKVRMEGRWWLPTLAPLLPVFMIPPRYRYEVQDGRLFISSSSSIPSWAVGGSSSDL